MRLSARHSTLTHDRVHKEHFAFVDVGRELGIVDLCLVRVLIALNQNLADADGTTTVPESLLHGLTWSKHTQ